MAPPISAGSTTTTVTFVRFVECCNGTVILFRGSLPIINGSVYNFTGTVPYLGSGGSLEPGRCYTVSQEITTNAIAYPGPPLMTLLSLTSGCEDENCFNCDPSNDCNCPEGFESIGGFCIGVESIDPIPPTTIVFTGNNVDGGGGNGLLTFESLNNFVWPLFSTPQLTADAAAMTIIPATGNNPITGDSWLDLNPLPQTGPNIGKHQPITTATPGGFPALPSPPNPPPSAPLRPLRESTITGTTLNYGGGNPIGYDNYEANLPPWNTWYTNVAVWTLPGLSVQNQYAGFLVCLEPTVSTDYQVIMSGNNGLRLFVDDYLAVEMLNGNNNSQALAYNNHFQITLSPGLHVLRLECYNYTGGGGLAAEVLECSAATVYGFTNINDFIPYRRFSTLWKRSRNLTVTGTGNNVITLTSGTTLPTDISGFIVQTSGSGLPANIFVTSVINSTTYTVNQNVPVGVYQVRLQFAYDVSSIASNSFSCPDGYTLTTCDGIACTRTVELPCSNNCYLIIPCDGTDSFISNNFELEAFIDQFNTVESDNYNGCAYITKLDDEDCENAVDVIVNEGTPCDCVLRCFYVENSNGFLYVDENDILQEVSALNANPNIKVCSKVPPIVFNDTSTAIVVENEPCILGDDGPVCSEVCFKLTNCDTKEEIYSTLQSLTQYISNGVVSLSGYEGCWEVEEASSNCECITVTIETRGGVAEYTATNIGTYNGWGVWQFTINGDDFFIWNNDTNPNSEWSISINECCAGAQLNEIYAQSKFNGDCPETISDGSLTGWVIQPGTPWINIQTEVCATQCNCPVNVTVLQRYDECIDCIKYKAYRLQNCENVNIVQYTTQDLSEYVGQIIETDCACWSVTEINYQPPSNVLVVIDYVFKTCNDCTSTLYRLTDCNNEVEDIVTKTNLQAYLGQVIKIENCDTCWEVTETREFTELSTVVVVQGFETCEDCGVPTVCECTKVTNLNQTKKTYTYYDCNNVLQSITLQPGESSDKVCALYWVTEPLFCSCIMFEVKGRFYYAFIVPGELINGKPVYNLCDSFSPYDCSTIYWDGFNWVIESPDIGIVWILPIPTSEFCPYGDWIEYNQEIGPNPIGKKINAEAAVGLISGPCDIDICTCIQVSIDNGTPITFYTIVIDSNGYPLYTDGTGSFIFYEQEVNDWVAKIEILGFPFTLDVDPSACPIGTWTPDQQSTQTVVSTACPPPNNEFTVFDHFEVFGECKNGVCPPPVFKNNRTVRPGYNTPICTPAKYDEITCRFADIIYKIVLEKRYGITNCCPDEDDKWLIKKELIDLQALKDPNYNCPECVCSCHSGNTVSTCNCKN